MGEVGEAVASWFLRRNGLSVLGSNVRVGRGEIDLLALDGSRSVVVEVRTVTRTGDPIDAIDEAKRRRVGQLASRVGASRVDFVGVGLAEHGVTIHWVPGGV